MKTSSQAIGRTCCQAVRSPKPATAYSASTAARVSSVAINQRCSSTEASPSTSSATSLLPAPARCSGELPGR